MPPKAKSQPIHVGGVPCRVHVSGEVVVGSMAVCGQRFSFRSRLSGNALEAAIRVQPRFAQMSAAAAAAAPSSSAEQPPPLAQEALPNINMIEIGQWARAKRHPQK